MHVPSAAHNGRPGPTTSAGARHLLVAAAALAAVGLVWLLSATAPPATAQLPDSGAQRLEMIQELRESNLKLAEVIGLLREIRDELRQARPATRPASPRP